MNRNYLLYLNKILLFFLVLFIFSCTSKIKNSNNLSENKSIEILSEVHGLGDKIKKHYKIKVHYVGTLEEGTEFDNSYKRNQPFVFQIGLRQVIPGWEIALMGMQVGGKKKFKVPPSLVNIYRELETDIEGFNIPTHGDLTKWAKQGVLLLNASLTVQERRANSHSKYWNRFTDQIIKTISDRLDGVVFLLWGNFARNKKRRSTNITSCTYH